MHEVEHFNKSTENIQTVSSFKVLIQDLSQYWLRQGYKGLLWLKYPSRCNAVRQYLPLCCSLNDAWGSPEKNLQFVKIAKIKPGRNSFFSLFNTVYSKNDKGSHLFCF